MKVAPLTGVFMIISILGFLISTMVIYDYSEAFGFASALIFVLMFIASMISMTYADVDTILMLEHRLKKRK